ncbi:MAG: twin-arginine translocase subunit TatC [Candidatus Thermoplasmatota archaeon]|jgi:sec-independent protein translocase protein TatC|nr:twin-arginine translocase subunit TatC [Candidatus Thermoplasmatota archaeon]MCL5790202.1 twin-arginine translocase subunit TatC [Candidatus Thermoplasmatota archaeon]
MSQDSGILGGKLFEYIDELLGRLRKTIIAFVVIFFSFFLLGPISVRFDGLTLYYPFPSFYGSFSVHILELMRIYLVPHKMTLIQVAPFDIVVSVVYISLAISISFIIPIIAFQLISFSRTALYPRERKAVTLSIVPTIILFVVGAIFSLKLILPLLFHFIYVFTTVVGVAPYLGVAQFVSIVVLITAGMGAVFETPVIVFSLSYIGLVPPSTWLKNWRYAVIGAFFVALLISPGATGGIMETTIAMIIIALYFSGALLARWALSKKINVEKKPAVS